MKKLKLEIESLAVESFDIPQETARRGTVRGHVTYTHPWVCTEECTANSCVTREYSCETYCGPACIEP